MLDRDFANRFLAFYLFGHESYQPDLDTFMSKAMAALNTLKQDQLDKIKVDFSKSMTLAYNIFKKEAFRKVRGSYSRLPPINKALFDALSAQFARISDDQRELLKVNRIAFKRALIDKLAHDEIFFAAVTSSTGDKNKTLYRHSEIIQLIKLHTM